MLKARLKTARINEIDFCRGVLLFLMAFDHFMFDFLSYGGIFTNFMNFPSNAPICQFADWWWTCDFRIYGRFVVLGLFFVISGVACYFSHNNWKRAILLLIVGGLIDLGFFLYGKISGSGDYVFFGPISAYGTAILIYSFFRFIFYKLRPQHKYEFKWIILGIGLVIIPIGIMFGCWDRYGPQSVGQLKTFGDYISVIIGYRQDSNATDWLPLFPYMGLLFTGACLGELLYPKRASIFVSHNFSNFRYEESEKVVNCYFTYRKHEIVYPVEKRSGIEAVPYAKSYVETEIEKHRLEKYANHYIVKNYYPWPVNYLLLTPINAVKNSICFLGHYSIFVYLLHQVIIILLVGIVLLALGYKLTIF